MDKSTAIQQKSLREIFDEAISLKDSSTHIPLLSGYNATVYISWEEFLSFPHLVAHLQYPIVAIEEFSPEIIEEILKRVKGRAFLGIYTTYPLFILPKVWSVDNLRIVFFKPTHWCMISRGLIMGGKSTFQGVCVIRPTILRFFRNIDLGCVNPCEKDSAKNPSLHDALHIFRTGTYIQSACLRILGIIASRCIIYNTMDATQEFCRQIADTGIADVLPLFRIDAPSGTIDDWKRINRCFRLDAQCRNIIDIVLATVPDPTMHLAEKAEEDLRLLERVCLVYQGMS